MCFVFFIFSLFNQWHSKYFEHVTCIYLLLLFFCIKKISGNSTPLPKREVPLQAPKSLFLRAPIITSTSCSVIVISPCGRWKEWVSRCHRSTNVVINAWPSFMDGTMCRRSKPSNLTMAITCSSTIGSRRVKSSWRHQQFSVPRGSCKCYNNRQISYTLIKYVICH